MRISEIIISHEQRLVEEIFNPSSGKVYAIFSAIYEVSVDDSIPASLALSSDEISDIILLVKLSKAEARNYFDEDSQTMQMIIWMQSYLQT